MVGPNVGVYAAVQEYGSAHTPAHPYLRPALDYSDTVVIGLFQDDADKALSQSEEAHEWATQQLTSPRVIVTREGHEPLEVQTDNRDMILWEKTRR